MSKIYVERSNNTMTPQTIAGVIWMVNNDHDTKQF